MQIEEYNHHGRFVSVQSHLKGKHQKHCLCYQNCKFFNPGSEDNCEIAKANFANCVKFGIVLPVWECPKYQQISELEAFVLYEIQEHVAEMTHWTDWDGVDPSALIRMGYGETEDNIDYDMFLADVAVIIDKIQIKTD